MNRAIVFLVLLSGCHTVLAANELRELEYAEEIERSSVIGKRVWLKAKNRDFLALYTETEQNENLGTAIILHAMGGHPNQNKLIKPLRTYLPKHNWATLSLQLPVLGLYASEQDYYALFADANDRIQAGIDYLVAAGVKNIVLIGYGLGGMMACYFVSEHSNLPQIKALVAISLYVPKSGRQEAQVAQFINKLKIPFLDIFSGYDKKNVTETARARRIAGKLNSAYRQFKIGGEGHTLQHDEGLLVKRVYSWIKWSIRKGTVTK